MNFKAQDVRVRLEETIRTGYEAVNTARRRIAVLQKAVQADQRVVADFDAQFKGGQPHSLRFA